MLDSSSGADYEGPNSDQKRIKLEEQQIVQVPAPSGKVRIPTNSFKNVYLFLGCRRPCGVARFICWIFFFEWCRFRGQMIPTIPLPQG